MPKLINGGVSPKLATFKKTVPESSTAMKASMSSIPFRTYYESLSDEDKIRYILDPRNLLCDMTIKQISPETVMKAEDYHRMIFTDLCEEGTELENTLAHDYAISRAVALSNPPVTGADIEAGLSMMQAKCGVAKQLRESASNEANVASTKEPLLYTSFDAKDNTAFSVDDLMMNNEHAEISSHTMGNATQGRNIRQFAKYTTIMPTKTTGMRIKGTTMPYINKSVGAIQQNPVETPYAVKGGYVFQSGGVIRSDLFNSVAGRTNTGVEGDKPAMSLLEKFAWVCLQRSPHPKKKYDPSDLIMLLGCNNNISLENFTKRKFNTMYPNTKTMTTLLMGHDEFRNLPRLECATALGGLEPIRGAKTKSDMFKKLVLEYVIEKVIDLSDNEYNTDAGKELLLKSIITQCLYEIVINNDKNTKEDMMSMITDYRNGTYPTELHSLNDSVGYVYTTKSPIYNELYKLKNHYDGIHARSDIFYIAARVLSNSRGMRTIREFVGMHSAFNSTEKVVSHIYKMLTGQEERDIKTSLPRNFYNYDQPNHATSVKPFYNIVIDNGPEKFERGRDKFIISSVKRDNLTIHSTPRPELGVLSEGMTIANTQVSKNKPDHLMFAMMAQIAYMPIDLIKSFNFSLFKNLNGEVISDIKYLTSIDHDEEWVSVRGVNVKYRIHAWYKIFPGRNIQLYISFRGSHTSSDWYDIDFGIFRGSAPYYDARVRNMFKLMRPILDALNRRIPGVDAYNVNVFSTGHSLGGFLSLMSGYYSLMGGMMPVTGRFKCNSYITPIAFNPFCGTTQSIKDAISAIPHGYVYRIKGAHILNPRRPNNAEDVASEMFNDMTWHNLSVYQLLTSWELYQNSYNCDHAYNSDDRTNAHIMWQFLGLIWVYMQIYSGGSEYINNELPGGITPLYTIQRYIDCNDNKRPVYDPPVNIDVALRGHAVMGGSLVRFGRTRHNKIRKGKRSTRNRRN